MLNLDVTKRRAGSRTLGGNVFSEFRSAIDRQVLHVFADRNIHRRLREHSKVNLEILWTQVAAALQQEKQKSLTRFRRPTLGQSDIHQWIVDGLPGEALFMASAMAFDSMQEALPFFGVSAKTARAKVGMLLPPALGEVALRIGRVLAMAGNTFQSLGMAHQYLRTPNFALGGAVPRDMLKTSEGEQLVLAELQTQADGGPV
jgi:uncharacterized protein (DUF2384 family)